MVEWEVMGISWDEVWCCSKGQKGETKVRQVLEAAEWPSAVLQVERIQVDTAVSIVTVAG